MIEFQTRLFSTELLFPYQFCIKFVRKKFLAQLEFSFTKMEINENTYSRNIIPTESHKRNGVKHFLNEIWSSEKTLYIG